MSRIKALDGLRAVACLAVVYHHTDMPMSGGGWLGVDVFFVLSGWLITGLLMDELRGQGRIGLAAFYIRRLGRLFPALIIACIVTALAYAAGVEARDGGRAAASIGTALTYTTNFWRAADNAGGIMGHAWSLAIEEQFYLLWPICLLLLRRPRRMLVAASVGCVISLAVMASEASGPIGLTNFGYFSLPTRAWELLFGGGLALAPLPPWLTGRRASWVGVLLITAAVAAVSVSGAGHAMWAVAVVVLASGLVVVSSRSEALPLRLLEIRGLQWIGARSYGLYLFHVPALAVAQHMILGRRLVVDAVGAAVALAITTVSFRFVETPVRAAVNRRLASGRGAGRSAAPAVDSHEEQPHGLTRARELEPGTAG